MSIWHTPGLHDAMARCLDEGLSAGETAAALSREFRLRISRNAVIGRAARSGVTLHGRKKKDDLAGRRKARADAMRVRRALSRLKQAVEVVLPTVTAEPAPIGPVHDIAAQGRCHWVQGDPAGREWRMCGHDVWRSSPYCPHHHGRAFDRMSTAASARKFRAAHLAEVA